MWFVQPFILLAFSVSVHSGRCYLCSNMDVKDVVNNIQDIRWKSWLKQAISDPRVNECNDKFLPEVALRSGAKSQDCDAGSCLKLSITEKSGQSFVWRSCIPESNDQIRADCTKVTTGNGELELCTCYGNLCNSTLKISSNIFLAFITILININM